MIGRFFRETLWRADLRKVKGPRFYGLATLRIAIHALRVFFADLGGIRAAGLTLTTLLALVPLLALASGIAKGLGYGARLDRILAREIAELPESVRPALEKIRELVQDTSFEAIGVVGSVLLAYAGLRLFVSVEQSFNRIWRVGRGRPWLRRVVDFVGVVVLVPLAVVGALFFQSLLHGAAWFTEVAWLEWIYRRGLGFVPYALVGVGFTVLYKVMPAARVRWIPALIAGVCSGAVWLVVHGLYIDAQLGAARMNAIYATFAALPLLIVYLQVTWTIVLVGAQVTAAIQNLDELRGPLELPSASFAAELRIALHLVGEACRRFEAGEKGCELVALASRLDVPVEWVEEAFEDLESAGLLGRVVGAAGVAVPLLPAERIDALAVRRALLGEDSARGSEGLLLPDRLESGLQEVERTAERELGGRRP